jgi:hypothetical protein
MRDMLNERGFNIPEDAMTIEKLAEYTAKQVKHHE